MRAEREGMKARTLRREKLNEFLGQLIRDYEVIGPKDESSHGPITAADELCLKDEKPAKSLKEFFLPTKEELVRYRRRDGGVEVSSGSSPGRAKRVIYGSRPCASLRPIGG